MQNAKISGVGKGSYWLLLRFRLITMDATKGACIKQQNSDQSEAYDMNASDISVYVICVCE
jgi:hypothetical protein